MKIIFIVTATVTDDSETETIVIGAFSTKAKATKAKKEWYDKEISQVGEELGIEDLSEDDIGQEWDVIYDFNISEIQLDGEISSTYMDRTK